MMSEKELVKYLNSLKKAQLVLISSDFNLPTNETAIVLRENIFRHVRDNPGLKLWGYECGMPDRNCRTPVELGTEEPGEGPSPTFSSSLQVPVTPSRPTISYQPPSQEKEKNSPLLELSDPMVARNNLRPPPSPFDFTNANREETKISECFRPISEKGRMQPDRDGCIDSDCVDVERIPLQPVSLPDLAATLMEMMRVSTGNRPEKSSCSKQDARDTLAFLQEVGRRQLSFSGAPGENFEEFLKKFKSAGRFFAVDDKGMLLVFEEVLKDAALRFLRTHPRECATWDSTQELFEAAFRKVVDPVKAQVDLLQRTQLANEKIDQFVSIIRTLNNRLGPSKMSDASLLPIVLHHLHPEYAQMV